GGGARQRTVDRRDRAHAQGAVRDLERTQTAPRPRYPLPALAGRGWPERSEGRVRGKRCESPPPPPPPPRPPPPSPPPPGAPPLPPLRGERGGRWGPYAPCPAWTRSGLRAMRGQAWSKSATSTLKPGPSSALRPAAISLN